MSEPKLVGVLLTAMRPTMDGTFFGSVTCSFSLGGKVVAASVPVGGAKFFPDRVEHVTLEMLDIFSIIEEARAIVLRQANV